MDHLAEEREEPIIDAAEEVKPRIAVDPVVVPVMVIDAVLVDVLGCRPEPVVRRRHLRDAPHPLQERDLVETPPPVDLLGSEHVDDVPARFARHRPCGEGILDEHRTSRMTAVEVTAMSSTGRDPMPGGADASPPECRFFK